LELIIVIVIILILFGGWRLPKISRSIGRTFGYLKKVTTEKTEGETKEKEEELEKKKKEKQNIYLDTEEFINRTTQFVITACRESFLKNQKDCGFIRLRRTSRNDRNQYEMRVCF
jgi:TatA/E family protein of Tat protein translocase